MTRAVESTLWLAILAALVAANGISPIAVPLCVVISAAILAFLLLVSWCRFDGGRHPCFLFLGMLLVFQGGRLVGSVLGITRDPVRIEVATAIPLDVTDASARIALFLIVASGIFVYIPCLLQYSPAHLSRSEKSGWLSALYVVILLTFPFALYKNLMYLLYIRAHGGYLVVYTDNAAVLQSAGPIARAVSIVCATALLIAYVVERRRGRVAAVLLLYFGLSALDLLIGFRGKVFTGVLSIWLLHNLKTGRRFHLVSIAVAAIAVNTIAIAVAAYREDNRIKMLSPIAFLAGQGVSMNVTEAAVEYRDRFRRHGFDYVIDGFTSGINPSTSKAEGKLWTNDLTTYLNPAAARLGFGTASAYLAELYLLGGIPAVLAGSVVVGGILSYLHRISSSTLGAITLAFVLPSLIYLPRVELLNPLAVLCKSAGACLVVAAGVIAARCLIDPLGGQGPRAASVTLAPE